MVVVAGQQVSISSVHHKMGAVFDILVTLRKDHLIHSYSSTNYVTGPSSNEGDSNLIYYRCDWTALRKQIENIRTSLGAFPSFIKPHQDRHSMM